MPLTIHKRKHRSRWWWLRWPFIYSSVIEREFLFNLSCVYTLDNGDQEDHNKLFGASYSLSPHKESARIGWRYNPGTRMFIVSAYCYVKGQRIVKDLCSVIANKKFIARILIKKDYYQFTVLDKESKLQIGSDSIPKWHNRKLGFKLGLYFGGNRTAPHNMTVQIKKV